MSGVATEPLLFAWRKAYSEGRLSNRPPAAFVPAMIVPDLLPTRLESDCRPIEIVSPNGCRVLVGRDFDEEVLGTRPVRTALRRLA